MATLRLGEVSDGLESGALAGSDPAAAPSGFGACENDSRD
jgi:hypothetical protein